MIGVYDYTVILTYMSLISAGTGIVVSLSGSGHPYWGVFFLLLCGLFDAFDGKVARTKANRSAMECNFGIQIDSLSDLIAFGVLPACIGVAMTLRSEFWADKLHMFDMAGEFPQVFVKILMYAILIFYVLAAMIRLAYFNVTEEERQRTEGGVRKYYTGLPVTSAALVFPLVMLLQYILPADIAIVYFPVVVLMGFAFVSKIKVRKPGLAGILAMIGIGALIFAALLIYVFASGNRPQP